MRISLVRTIGCAVAIIFLASVLLISAFLLSRDYTIELPYGYKLAQIWAGAMVLSGPVRHAASSEIIISQNIDSYGVCGSVLVGHRSPMRVPGADPGSNHTYGYFIVDMRSREVQQGLNKKDWLHQLSRYGITHPPRLLPPSRWDRFFRARELRGK